METRVLHVGCEHRSGEQPSFIAHHEGLSPPSGHLHLLHTPRQERLQSSSPLFAEHHLGQKSLGSDLPLPSRKSLLLRETARAIDDEGISKG